MSFQFIDRRGRGGNNKRRRGGNQQRIQRRNFNQKGGRSRRANNNDNSYYEYNQYPSHYYYYYSPPNQGRRGNNPRYPRTRRGGGQRQQFVAGRRATRLPMRHPVPPPAAPQIMPLSNGIPIDPIVYNNPDDPLEMTITTKKVTRKLDPEENKKQSLNAYQGFVHQAQYETIDETCICWAFNSLKGCRFGDKCRWLHVFYREKEKSDRLNTNPLWEKNYFRTVDQVQALAQY